MWESWRSRSVLPPACLFGHKAVWLAQEHLRGQVPSQLSAEWAGHYDGLEWELSHTCRDIPSAPFAGDNELFPLQDWEPKTHWLSIGEYMAKCHPQGQATLGGLVPLVSDVIDYSVEAYS